jgi:hypothetical protein
MAATTDAAGPSAATALPIAPNRAARYRKRPAAWAMQEVAGLTHTWLGQLRRLAVRNERCECIHVAPAIPGCTVICPGRIAEICEGMLNVRSCCRARAGVFLHHVLIQHISYKSKTIDCLLTGPDDSVHPGDFRKLEGVPRMIGIERSQLDATGGLPS